MSEGNTPETSNTSGMNNAPRQTVWLYEDDAMRQLDNHLPAAHWSEQITQPLGRRPLPVPLRRRMPGRGARVVPRWGSPIPRRGIGYGVLLMLAALALIVALALANGWLSNSSSAGSDSSQWPIPVQPATPTLLPTATMTVPAATNIPTSTALPTATAQPTATTQPTATPEPTATPSPMPTPTKMPSP